MLRNRSVVFKDFKSFEQEKDKRSMDEICNGNSPSDFMLQAQQKFLVQYMKTNSGEVFFYIMPLDPARHVAVFPWLKNICERTPKDASL